MLQSLIEWLTGGLASVLDIIITMFLNALEPSLSNFIDTFPGFAAAYDVFRIIGAGLAVTIATVGLFSFFSGSGSLRSTEQPWQLLGRVAVSGALMVGGGYILSYLVELAKFSYDVFFNLDYAAGDGAGLGGLLLGTGKKYVSTIFTNFQTVGATLFAAADGSLVENLIVSDLAVSLLILFLDVAVGWELFKVMIEVAERYLMVGVLVYTSPLVFSTVASGQTASIFKRWCGMFFSSLLLMSLSVFFLNASIAALASIGADDSFIVSLVLILAMLKIAQRIDSYMNQLGLNAAQTGGSLLDTIFAGARTIGSFAKSAFGGGRGGEIGGKVGGGSVLGRALGVSTVGKYARAAQSAGESILHGEGMKAAAQSASDSLKADLKDSVLGGFKDNGIRGAANNAKETVSYVMTGVRTNKADGSGRKTEAGKRDSHTSTAPADKAAAASSSAERAEAVARHRGDVLAEDIRSKQAVEHGHGVPDADLVERAGSSNASRAEMLRSFHENGIEEIRPEGVTDADDRYVMKADKSGNLALSDAAVAAGLHMETDTDGKTYVTGPSEALQEYMDKATTADRTNVDANGDRIAARAVVTEEDAAQELGMSHYDGVANMAAVQERLAQMRSDIGDTAKEMPELTANTIKRDSSGHLSRNIFATTEVPDGTKEYGQTSGNMLFDRAFGASVPDKAEDSGFRNVRIEENDGASGHKGRCVSAEYTNREGQSVRVKMYDRLSELNGVVPEGSTKVDYTGIGYDNRPMSRSFFMVSTPAFAAQPDTPPNSAVQHESRRSQEPTHEKSGDTGFEPSPVTPKLSNGTKRVTGGSRKKETVKRNSKNKPSGPPV